jgi:D-xylulose reductase
MVFAATPPYDGTLARYYCLPGDLAHLIPDTMSLEEGALASIIALNLAFATNILVAPHILLE